MDKHYSLNKHTSTSYEAALPFDNLKFYFVKSFENIAIVFSKLFKTNSAEHTTGLYYKTLRTRNLQQMARFRNKLVSFLLSVEWTNILVWTNTLAHYRIHNCKSVVFLQYRSHMTTSTLVNDTTVVYLLLPATSNLV